MQNEKPHDVGVPATQPKMISMPVGVVVRRAPGTSRWATWNLRPVALLPGAAPADWQVLRTDGDVTEYHAATLPLELHRADTEAYRVALSNNPPSAFVVMAPSEQESNEFDYRVRLITASPFEAQDWLDSGEELVEPVPLPAGLIAWIREFVDAHHVDQPFRKRKRDRVDVDQQEVGKGDARIRQVADVFRPPRSSFAHEDDG